MMLIKRCEDNPILIPDPSRPWESKAVFNPSVTEKDGKIVMLYRAMSFEEYRSSIRTYMSISQIGAAESTDGIHFRKRWRFIVPKYEWERFGCEDPRVTKIGGKYYVFYTALGTWPPRADGIRVGLAISKDLKSVEKKHLVTPFNAKAMSLFPSKINGYYWGILTVNTDKPPASVCLIPFKKISDVWNHEYWMRWYSNYQKYALPLKRRPVDHVESGPQPLRTRYGWLVFYSYIKDYFAGRPLFTVEAVLLDLRNPLKIIGKIQYPLLTPVEYYERIGVVPDVVFPSGALIKDDTIYLYYGGADTVCCLGFIKLSALVKRMVGRISSVKVRRFPRNPILEPIREHPWEEKAVFNPGAVYLDGKVHLVYRAMSMDNTSVFGYAVSKNGCTIDYRSPEPIYIPRKHFEQKQVPGGNSGCEDPRLTLIGNRIYMLYTAYNGRDPPRVAITHISVKDFLNHNWNAWAEPRLISPPGVDDKDACLFPEKFKEGYLIVHRIGRDIDYAYVSTLRKESGVWLDENRFITPRKGMWDSEKVGAAGPPIKTKEGWILFYHGVSEDKVYRVGAVLLDLKQPTEVIARTEDPILEPEKSFEIQGQVPNVVFPCGNVLINDTIYLYYGGADTVCCVATIKLKKLLQYLKECKL
jgi:predicted GH43/DUF377 family glycosyl hydrolase